MTKDNDMFATIMALLLWPFSLFIHMLVEGWVLTTLWHWFIVPQFGLKDLSYSVAVGIALLPSFLLAGVSEQLATIKNSAADKEDDGVLKINSSSSSDSGGSGGGYDSGGSSDSGGGGGDF